MSEESLNLEIELPDGRMETREIYIECGLTALYVSYRQNEWVIRQSPNGPLDRQTHYKTLEEATREAVKLVAFRERTRLYEAALRREVGKTYQPS